MRIRKRQVPLPFSSLSPVPLSDPLLLLHRTPPPLVQLQRSATFSPPEPSTPPPNPSHGRDTAPHLPLQPSDRPNPHPDAWDSVDDATGEAAGDDNNASEKKLQKQVEEDDGDEEEGEKRNDTRSVFGAETSNGVLPESSSSPQVVGRWCEREKAFPLKKRRGNFERRENEETAVKILEKEKKKMMKTKMNKKCTLQKQEGEEESKVGLDLTGAGGKKRSRGGALMEGSRCSRVNGRGWRCCQQTLVGYSLCEHHLGKGRLRSMNSVRSRSLAAAAAAPKKEPPPLTLASKKRMKLGVVKARSISSLLGQTDNAMAAPPPPPPDDNVNK